MTKWDVEYEVRLLGAIGVFWLLFDQVEAESSNQAKELFRAKYGNLYEMRAGLAIEA